MTKSTPIKAIALDLDGTLLTTNKKISSRTVRLINSLVDQGVFVCIATGRSLSTTKQFIEHLNITTPLICYNGACIHDMKNNADISHITIDEQIGREMVRLSMKTTAYFHMFLNHQLYFAPGSETADFLEPMSAEIGTTVDLASLADTRFTKGMYVGEPDVTLPIKNELERLFPNQLNIVYSHPQYLEVMPKEATKGKALAALLEQNQIAASETIAFGDAENDVEMLTWARYGVAMGNSPEHVRLLAPYTTMSNDEDGVAVWLENFFQNS